MKNYLFLQKKILQFVKYNNRLNLSFLYFNQIKLTK